MPDLTQLRFGKRWISRLLERNPFDLLIVGDHLPHMDAEVISRELRDAEVILRELREKHPRTPVVLCLVQQNLDESEMERFRSAGATAVISRQDQNSIFAQVGFYLRPANSGLRNVGVEAAQCASPQLISLCVSPDIPKHSLQGAPITSSISDAARPRRERFLPIVSTCSGPLRSRT